MKAVPTSATRSARSFDILVLSSAIRPCHGTGPEGYLRQSPSTSTVTTLPA
ncbi:hypothetical protein [Rathayibacter sp. VKM Ac-2630]|uniref:hypothetical protein n=1 Tax=Rathayibacter sp. VKM Ac-2630 TaxID=1938617 RepID=UPI00156E71CF|nr:hypothetical protein [Rathayibacter sp. VKM Ac-2630]